jgi:hypothetical protein
VSSVTYNRLGGAAVLLPLVLLTLAFGWSERAISLLVVGACLLGMWGRMLWKVSRRIPIAEGILLTFLMHVLVPLFCGCALATFAACPILAMTALIVAADGAFGEAVGLGAPIVLIIPASVGGLLLCRYVDRKVGRRCLWRDLQVETP